MKGKTPPPTTIEINAGELATISVAIVGTTPFICNRMSRKVWEGLLLPSGKKTQAEKEQRLKHEPLQEFRDSPYTLPAGPTLLAILGVSIKKAAMTAALDTPGAKKTQVGRLLRVAGERLPLYGVPQMLMSVTRSADMNRTPDVRTRAILPRWAAMLEVVYPVPLLREKSVLNLIAAGGQRSGVGDWRQEKGSGDYGLFRLAGLDDPELQEIVAQGGRAAQVEGMNVPTFYDDETESLYAWYLSEAASRGFKVAR